MVMGDGGGTVAVASATATAATVALTEGDIGQRGRPGDPHGGRADPGRGRLEDDREGDEAARLDRLLGERRVAFAAATHGRRWVGAPVDAVDDHDPVERVDASVSAGHTVIEMAADDERLTARGL